MANEKRKVERRDFTYYMKVTDAATGNLIGYLVDISTGGFKLDSEKAVPVGRDFRLHLELSGDIANKSSLIFSARSIWCQPDPIDPTAFKVGFQIVGLGSGDSIIFQRMYEKYAASKPNHNQNYGSTLG
jgi:tryptophanyl-tRNA synthetase